MTDTHNTPQTDRRKFLGNSALTIAGLGAAALTTAPAFAAKRGNARRLQAGTDVEILQGALALEHEGIAAYQIAGAATPAATLTPAGAQRKSHKKENSATFTRQQIVTQYHRKEPPFCPSAEIGQFSLIFDYPLFDLEIASTDHPVA